MWLDSLYSFPDSVWERILGGSASNTVRLRLVGEKIKRVETRPVASLQRLSVGNLLIRTVLALPSILQLKNLWQMRGRASLKAFPDRVRERGRSREWGLEGNNVA